LLANHCNRSLQIMVSENLVRRNPPGNPQDGDALLGLDPGHLRVCARPELDAVAVTLLTDGDGEQVEVLLGLIPAMELALAIAKSIGVLLRIRP
jgi:hypothetical protein